MVARLHIMIMLVVLGHGHLSAQNFWQQTSGPSAGAVTALVSHPDGSIFAATAGGVFKTTNNGGAWRTVNTGLASLNVFTLTLTSSGTLIAGTQSGAFRLPNQGTAWLQTSLAGVQVQALGARSSAEVYAGLPAVGVLKSTNDGVSWNATPLGNATPTSFAFSGSTGPVFAGTLTGVFRSTDAGAQWSPVNNGLTNTNVSALVVENSGALFAGTVDAGIFRTTDNGALWVPVDSGLSTLNILSLTANALSHLFAGTNAGVFRSTDTGASWQPINGGLSEPVIRSLVVDSGGRLFAGGGANGIVFRSVESTAGTFTVVQPNGGEDWQIGTVQQVRWTSTGITGLVRIELTRNAGVSYATITDSTANTGVYPLTITGPATTQARIRVSSFVDPVLADSSNALFSISTVPSATITVVSPNGGENWQVGTVQNIQWTSSNLSGKVKIELSRNNGQVFTALVDSTIDTGTFPWTVAGPATTAGRVRISSIVNGSVVDISDGAFTISLPPSITILQPNGGENWQIGTTQIIQWTSVNVSGKVKIEVSRDGGQSYASIIDSVDNTGAFDWVVTGPTTVSARMRITSIVFPAAVDVSDNSFTVTPAPSVTVVVPNGGEVFQIGSIDTIRWTSGGVTGNARIEISRDGGSTFTVIDPAAQNIGVYAWRVTGPRTGLGRVRVVLSPPGLPSVADTSDNDFVISALSVVAPDTVVSGASATIVVRPPANYVVTLANLFVRNGGKTAYDSLNLSQAGSNFQAAIPPNYINIRGVEFYVLLSDGRIPLTFPDSTPSLNPAAIRVRVRNIPSSSAFQRRVYKMVSVPVELTDPSITGTFADDYGSYDRSRWRLFRWEGGAYAEFPGIAATATPGNAFWLITHAGTPFDIDEGLSTSTRQPYTITIPPGWSQMADPFAFRIDWNSVARESTLIGPYYYDRGSFRATSVRVLQPWEGYFVYNTGTQPVSIAIPPVEADSVLPLMNDWPDVAAYGLRLSASAPGSGLAEAENIVGFSRHPAGATFHPEPPVIADEYIRLSIVDGSETHVVSLKHMPAEGTWWDMKLSTTLQDKIIHFQLNEHGQLPQGFEIFVLDRDDAALIPVQAGAFTVYVRARSRSLRVIVGTRKFAEDHSEDIPLVPLHYELSQNYPNPFNPETKIRYQLSKRSLVKLEIYNIVGQKVRTLVSGEQTTGTYELAWNGTNDRGGFVGSGVYMYRLQAEASAGGPGDHLTVTRKMVFIR